MQDADLLLLFGSTDSHYNGLEIVSLLVGGPADSGVFHEASTVPELGRQLGGVGLVTYASNEGVEAHFNEVKLALCESLPPRPMRFRPARRNRLFPIRPSGSRRCMQV